MRKKFAGKNVICANFSLPALTSCNRSFRLSVFSFSLPSWVYLCAVLKREKQMEALMELNKQRRTKRGVCLTSIIAHKLFHTHF